MTRRMSVSMTVDAVRDRTKTVTRRHVDTWKTLKPGDRLTLIEKGMGLAKGEKQVVLAEVEVVSVTEEWIASLLDTLHADRQRQITADEGLPHMSIPEFVAFWMDGHGYRRVDVNEVKCRRIEWRYLDEVHQCDPSWCCRSCGRHSVPHVGCILR